MFEKNTPRDFVLHLGAFIILYYCAVALITLLFDVINYVLPDQLQGYSDPYSGPMRFAIASLVVLTPLTVYLFYLIQGASRKDPDRRTLGVRKWLTYITLLVTGGTIAGDLIFLLNDFLGGELASAFLLKVLVIFAVMGAGFAYFYFDIKGYWNKKPDHSRYVGMGVMLVVLASIVGGMVFLGSPMKQRQLRLDIEQVADLLEIQSNVLNYRAAAGAFPETLTVLENGPQGFVIPKSPEDRPAYQYQIVDEDTFKLCAMFAEDSVPNPYSRAIEPALGTSANWEHKAGPVCFERTIDPAFFKPQEVITVPAPVKNLPRN